MRRTIALGAAATLATVLLGGCGGGGSSSTASYCHTIRQTQAQLGNLSTPGNLDFAKIGSALHSVAASAPADVQPDWQLLASKFDRVVQALKNAGVSSKAISQAMKGQVPSGIDPTEVQRAFKQVEALATPAVRKAAADVQKNVRSTCHLDLGSRSGGTGGG
ncbi:MAG TPA: hypothetical protein VFI30_01005 [Nocardioidaceae bacterium]|nr:hypothetical protein [Nocardioidaceae bacterium]